MNLHLLPLTSLLRGNLSSYIIITPSPLLPSQLEALCLLLQLYFGTRVISFAVLFCALFFLMFCSVLFCVICANAARFSITLSCECAYVIRSPPTQKSVPLSQRGWNENLNMVPRAAAVCLPRRTTVLPLSVSPFLPPSLPASLSLSFSRALALLWFPAFARMQISGKSVAAQHRCR